MADAEQPSWKQKAEEELDRITREHGDEDYQLPLRKADGKHSKIDDLAPDLPEGIDRGMEMNNVRTKINNNKRKGQPKEEWLTTRSWSAEAQKMLIECIDRRVTELGQGQASTTVKRKKVKTEPQEIKQEIHDEEPQEASASASGINPGSGAAVEEEFQEEEPQMAGASASGINPDSAAGKRKVQDGPPKKKTRFTPQPRLGVGDWFQLKEEFKPRHTVAGEKGLPDVEGLAGQVLEFTDDDRVKIRFGVAYGHLGEIREWQENRFPKQILTYDYVLHAYTPEQAQEINDDVKFQRTTTMKLTEASRERIEAKHNEIVTKPKLKELQARKQDEKERCAQFKERERMMEEEIKSFDREIRSSKQERGEKRLSLETRLQMQQEDWEKLHREDRHKAKVHEELRQDNKELKEELEKLRQENAEMKEKLEAERAAGSREELKRHCASLERGRKHDGEVAQKLRQQNDRLKPALDVFTTMSPKELNARHH